MSCLDRIDPDQCVAFDLLADEAGRSLLASPFAERRKAGLPEASADDAAARGANARDLAGRGSTAGEVQTVAARSSAQNRKFARRPTLRDGPPSKQGGPPQGEGYLVETRNTSC